MQNTAEIPMRPAFAHLSFIKNIYIYKTKGKNLVKTLLFVLHVLDGLYIAQKTKRGRHWDLHTEKYLYFQNTTLTIVERNIYPPVQGGRDKCLAV